MGRGAWRSVAFRLPMRAAARLGDCALHIRIIGMPSPKRRVRRMFGGSSGPRGGARGAY